MSEEVWREYIRQKMGTALNSNLFQKFFGE